MKKAERLAGASRIGRSPLWVAGDPAQTEALQSSASTRMWTQCEREEAYWLAVQVSLPWGLQR
jgi:hypothetical protein